MKTVVFTASCAIAAFAGLFFYLQTPTTPKSDSVPLVAELPTNPKKPSADDEEPPRRTKANPPAANNPKPPKGQERNAWSDAPKPGQKPKTPYYTIVASRGPVPSRVIIHNTSLGVPLTIILIGADSADGQLFIRRGTRDNHQWEVAVTDGLLGVFWDGKEVPPG